MVAQGLWLLLALVVLGGDEGARPPWGSTRCTPIPQAMVLCQDIGYRDAAAQLNWTMPQPLMPPSSQSAGCPCWSECHPDARLFLCSVFALVCLGIPVEGLPGEGRGPLFSQGLCWQLFTNHCWAASVPGADRGGRTKKDFFVRVFLAEGGRCPWDKETQTGVHPWGTPLVWPHKPSRAFDMKIEQVGRLL